MSDEQAQRERLVRRADVLRSRALRSLDALARKNTVHGAIQAVVDRPTRDRITKRARRLALALGVGLAALVLALAVRHLKHRPQ
jgi:hypothetical protein